MRNDAHFQFHTEFRDLVVKFDAETLKIKKQFDVYLPLYAREDEALKKINKSSLTQKIQDADKERDKVFANMVEVNKAMGRHFNPEIAEAANKIKIVFDTYGNVARKPLNEQTSAVYNLLQDLRSDKYKSAMEKSGILDWVNELEVRNLAFDKLMKERFDETASKCDIVLKQARIELDEAYIAIAGRINALMVVDGEEAYEKFVKTLNAVIEKYAVKRKK
jgi:hypothetical protein